ncbi:MAG: AmmeMemoRadiSam system radical SAM enzyme [FCB group bacterium]|jgi:pyruvate formate lyase activating enzyme
MKYNEISDFIDCLSCPNNFRLSKRDFLKYSLVGLSAMTGLLRLKAFASGDSGLWKWSKEAYHYTSMSNKTVKCLNCPNTCVLPEGGRSRCRNKVNKGGKLYTLAYGNPCTANIDPVEKKPLFHFLPNARAYSIAAAGCNLRCLYCQNWEISQVQPEDTKNFDMFPAQVVENCLDNKCECIAYTYSEPNTFYEYMYDIAKLARKKGIKNLIVSNGYINEKPLLELCEYIDAATITLKNFKESIYNELNGASLQPVLNSLKTYRKKNVWLEIVNLVVPNWTDDMNMIKSMCEWLVKNDLSSCPLQFLRFFPLYKLTQLPPTPISTLEKAREIALKAGMKYVYIGNVPGNPAENTYCPKCKKLIIERRGIYLLNNYVTKSRCKFCGEKIDGVWNN